MEVIKKHKKEILISLITGIFLFYLQPVLSFLGDLFVKTFVLASDQFSSNYYTSIAKNDPNLFADWSNFLLIVIVSIVVLYSILYLVGKKNDLKKSINSTIENISRTKNRLTKKETEEEKSKEEILKELESLEARASTIQASLLKRDNMLISFYILSFFLLILLFSNYAITKAVASVNLEFRNDLIKIAPYINEDEMKLFEARRSSIKNANDYYLLKKTIQDLKNKNRVD